jgi:hypothetical protein
VALEGGVRPEETRPRNLVGLWIVQAASDVNGPRWLELDTQRIQGRASIEILVPVFGPQSPTIGYAPLVNRTKRWANESPIEGWFPLSRGERPCCEVVRNKTARPKLKHRPPRSTDQPGTVDIPDAGCHLHGTRREGEVRLDSLPHRRHLNPPNPSMPHGIGAVQPLGLALRHPPCRVERAKWTELAAKPG